MDDVPAVSKRPRVYGSSPIMTVTASTGQRLGQREHRQRTVVKDSGNVFRRELIRSIRDQETCPGCQLRAWSLGKNDLLSDSSVTDNDTFDGLHSVLWDYRVSYLLSQREHMCSDARAARRVHSAPRRAIFANTKPQGLSGIPVKSGTSCLTFQSTPPPRLSRSP
jgi:hypothetical protein